MHRRSILATLALGLVCALASAPTPVLAGLAPQAPTLHSAAALRDLWAIRSTATTPEAMEAELVARFGPLPWHFEAGNGTNPGKVSFIADRIHQDLQPTGTFDSPFLGLSVTGTLVALPHRPRTGNVVKTVEWDRYMADRVAFVDVSDPDDPNRYRAVEGVSYATP